MVRGKKGTMFPPWTSCVKGDTNSQKPGFHQTLCVKPLEPLCSLYKNVPKPWICFDFPLQTLFLNKSRNMLDGNASQAFFFKRQSVFRFVPPEVALRTNTACWSFPNSHNEWQQGTEEAPSSELTLLIWISKHDVKRWLKANYSLCQWEVN